MDHSPLTRRLLTGWMLLIMLWSCQAAEQPSPNALRTTVPAPSAPETVPPASPPARRALPNPEWETEWLHAQPCAPPCFAGIVPETTTVTHAVHLLEANAAVAYVKIVSDTTVVDYGSVEWGWLAGFGGGTALFTPSVDIIHTITVNSNPIRLDTLIDAYGDPSDVLALRSTFVEPPDAEMVGYSVWILYRQYGLLIPFQDSGAIGPGTLLHTPRFFAATPQGLARHLQERELRNLVAWAGYQPLSFYCREVSTGDHCAP
jgi:hypothetical protein